MSQDHQIIIGEIREGSWVQVSTLSKCKVEDSHVLSDFSRFVSDSGDLKHNMGQLKLYKNLHVRLQIFILSFIRSKRLISVKSSCQEDMMYNKDTFPNQKKLGKLGITITKLNPEYKEILSNKTVFFSLQILQSRFQQT